MIAGFLNHQQYFRNIWVIYNISSASTFTKTNDANVCRRIPGSKNVPMINSPKKHDNLVLLCNTAHRACHQQFFVLNVSKSSIYENFYNLSIEHKGPRSKSCLTWLGFKHKYIISCCVPKNSCIINHQSSWWSASSSSSSSPIMNHHSSIINRQASIITRQSSIVKHQSSITNRSAIHHQSSSIYDDQWSIFINDLLYHQSFIIINTTHTIHGTGIFAYI